MAAYLLGAAAVTIVPDPPPPPEPEVVGVVTVMRVRYPGIVESLGAWNLQKGDHISFSVDG